MTKPKPEAFKVGPLRVAPFVRGGIPSSRWLIDLPPHVAPSGKRSRLFFETKTVATAEAKRLLRELQLDGVIRGQGPKLTGITFSELSRRWLAGQTDRVLTNKKRAISLETHAHRLKALLAHISEKDISRLGAQEIIAYQKARLSEGRSPATVNSETRLFRQIMSWALEHELIGRVAKIEPIPEPRKRLSVPSIDEVMALIRVLPPRTALLVRFLAETGCRKGEAFALEWSDLDQANSLVMIRRKEGWTPKTESSDRDIPVASALMVALEDARREAKKDALRSGSTASRYVFPGRGGVKLTDIDKALATAVKAAGIKRDGKLITLTPHVLRKAHATWQKQRGIDDSLLQPRLGHAPGSRVTAQNYVHFPSEALRSTVIDLDLKHLDQTNRLLSRCGSKRQSAAEP